MATDEQILARTTELLANLQEKCWPGYEKKGMKKMFGKMYPNCVKKSKKKKRKNEEVDLYEEKVLRFYASLPLPSFLIIWNNWSNFEAVWAIFGNNLPIFI